MPEPTATQMLAALRETKGLVCLAAKRLGCHPRVLLAAAQQHPALRDAIEAERSEMVDVGESALYRAVLQGEAWAIQFLLKTRARERGYGERAGLARPLGLDERRAEALALLEALRLEEP